jgi:hypothetical protein
VGGAGAGGGARINWWRWWHRQCQDLVNTEQTEVNAIQEG